jgi:hypothetical protein
MFPRLRNSHVTVVALACAVILAPARGDEPCPKCTMMMQRVYAVADLVVLPENSNSSPISEILSPMNGTSGSFVLGSPVNSTISLTPAAPSNCAADSSSDAVRLGCDFEFMCQQPADPPCCKAAGCCQGADCCPNRACCPDGPCCKTGSCCQGASCCPNGACCPDGPCCPKAVTNWTAIAAPEWCPPAAPKPQLHEQLIKLITKNVCPNCWAEAGGSCTLDYYPLGMGLVVNAPADVQEQVADLIEALRRLQDTEVAFDVKVVAVGDVVYKELFDKEAAASFDGGMPMFLNPQQAKDLWQAMQSDQHTHALMAPKLTVFNGQKASIRCTQSQNFVTDMTKVSGASKISFDELRNVPGQPVPLSLAESCSSVRLQACMPSVEAISLGFQMAIRPTVSADHKFVRCELNAEYSELEAAPLFPVTTFVTPIFEGGAQGQPIPFTQMIQQPSIVKRGVSRSMAIPDGGTAVLYAGKRTKEDEAAVTEEESAPLFDWIYDLVDLFNPPEPTPTYEEHLFVLVTPRVIMQHGEMADAQPMPVGPCQAPCCPAPTVKQCAAMADAQVYPPAPAMPGPLCAVPPECAVAPCPMAPPCPSARSYVQLDVCVLCMDPAAWDKPVTAAWADLSPKACDGKPKVMSPEEATRFCQSMKTQQVGKVRAEPRLGCLSGHPGTFLSGGQQAMPQATGGGNSGCVVGTQFEPFGMQLSFLPVETAGGVFLQCEYKMSSPQEHPAASTAGTATQMNGCTSRVWAQLPCGRTLLFQCGRNAEGEDVIVTATPHLVDSMPAPAVLPAPTPMFSAARGVDNAEDPTFPLPTGHPRCDGKPTCMTNSLPASATCPTPITPPVIQASHEVYPAPITPPVPARIQEPEPQPLLAKFLAKYRQACAVGDKAKAQAYADCCLALDPTCFGK